VFTVKGINTTMKMKGLHRYPNGVAFGGRADVAIFKSDGDPKLVDTGVPQGCLAIDFTTPALWRKAGPNISDWVKVENPKSSYVFSRKDVEAVSWLLIDGSMSSDRNGHIVINNSELLDVHVSLEKPQICTFEVVKRMAGGFVTIATIATAATERKKIKVGVPVVLKAGDEIAVKMTKGDNDVVVTVTSY